MIRKEENGVEWLEFELLQPFSHISHAIFTKNAGDLAYYPYTENARLKAFQAIKMGNLLPIHANQVHGAHVQFVTKDSPNYIENCDSLLTNTQELALCIQHADCQVGFFYDKVASAIACVHCGWRSSVQNIYKRTIECFQKQFGSRPEDILVCISPSLGPKHAEFVNYEKELPKQFWQFQTKPLHFDFWQISRWQLENAGIKPEHIQIANMCTYEQKELFYSYRRDHHKERNMSCIYLKKPL